MGWVLSCSSVGNYEINPTRGARQTPANPQLKAVKGLQPPSHFSERNLEIYVRQVSATEPVTSAGDLAETYSWEDDEVANTELSYSTPSDIKPSENGPRIADCVHNSGSISTPTETSARASSPRWPAEISSTSSPAGVNTPALLSGYRSRAGA